MLSGFQCVETLSNNPLPWITYQLHQCLKSSATKEQFMDLIDWAEAHRPEPSLAKIYCAGSSDGPAIVVSSGQRFPSREDGLRMGQTTHWVISFSSGRRRWLRYAYAKTGGQPVTGLCICIWGRSSWKWLRLRLARCSNPWLMTILTPKQRQTYHHHQPFDMLSCLFHLILLHISNFLCIETNFTDIKFKTFVSKCNLYFEKKYSII